MRWIEKLYHSFCFIVKVLTGLDFQKSMCREPRDLRIARDFEYIEFR